MTHPLSSTLIRPAREDEADTIAGLHVAIWRATYRDYASAEALATLDEAKRLPYWIEALASDDPRTGVLVAETAGAISGIISFGPSSHAAFGGRTEIKHLYVQSYVQSQGIGRRLLTSVLERPDIHAGNGVGLAVVRQNERARRFYQTMGGVEIGTFTDPGPLWRSDNIVMAWDS
ncbi:GNAT family N-acetyltransferase [Gymnodinialimonas sp. 2305UL16-5]|uniref:GNAT family N-acetyltransferase n=1 Tax=Gymnodinialimonas mytili TaxID=3126503 RepID=UPI0030974AB5